MKNFTTTVILNSILVMTSGCASSRIVTSIDGHEVEVKCQPIYGSWCGKDYPAYEATGFKPDPVDQWDEACMEHDLCYDQNGKSGIEKCDREFSHRLERLNISGVPAPHQIINAYNVFKDKKPFREINVSLQDMWNVKTTSCDGRDGVPTIFCDVGMGRDNCEISMGKVDEGERCFCDYPAFYGQRGFFRGGRLWGKQRTASHF